MGGVPMFRLLRLNLGLALWGVMIISNGAFSYARKVLFEDYTSTTCPPCAAAAPEIEAGLEIVGHERVASIAYHMNWPAPGNDPWYHNNPNDNNTRRSYYGVNAIPYYVIDGTQYNGSRTRQALSQAILNRQQTASPLLIEVNGRVINNELRAHVEVTSESQLNNLTLYVAVTERYWRYQAPTGQNDHYDSMLKMLPDGRGTSFSINQNQTLSWDFSVGQVDTLSWHEDLRMDNLAIIVWVQAANREVLQSQNFFLGYDVPAVGISEWVVSDEHQGDGDGRVEPGEVGEIFLTLANAPNYAAAERIEVTLSTEDEGVEITNAMWVVEGLAGGERINNQEAPFEFRVLEGVEPHPITFTFQIVVMPGEIELSEDISFMLGWPYILLVDAANHVIASELMRGRFGLGELPYIDVWDRVNDGPVDPEFLDKHRLIIWHSFNNQREIITEFEADALLWYLDQGGMLVMATPYFQQALGDHRLRRERFGVEVEMPNVGGNYVVGEEGHPQFSGMRAFLGGGQGAGFPTAKASLRPLIEGVTPVMHYTDQAGNQLGIAGMIHEAGDYRTMLLGFPLESIGGAARTDTLGAVLARIWNWANNPPQSAPSPQPLPYRFTFYPAYPNPFNSTTTLRFTLDRGGEVRLGIFDLAGREVALLNNGELPVGVHTFNFDPQGLGLVGGLYLLRLQHQGRTSIQKVVYLR